MALEGTIKDFGLPDIFQLIGLQRKTGMLALNNGLESVTVAFENGMVVMADSSARRLEDRLGNVLVKQGKLTRERLDEALSVQKQTLQRLGHVLASTSAITGKDLRDALQIQISQIVFRVFRWRDGRYQFTPSDSVDYDRENFAPMSTDFILMEGIRMVDEWPIIEKKIPSFDIVFRPVVDPSLIEVAAASEGEAAGSDRHAAATGRAHGAGDHRQHRSRRVRGVPHPLRFPEPQPDRRCGARRLAGGRARCASGRELGRPRPPGERAGRPARDRGSWRAVSLALRGDGAGADAASRV